MNNQLRVYSNLADAPDIPNEYALGKLLDRRVVHDHRGKLRYEHIYEIYNDFYFNTIQDVDSYEFIKTIDHGEVGE